MAVTISNHQPVPLSAGARQAGLTSQGLLKILRRTGRAIRDDGRWFVDPDIVEKIVVARQLLGVDRRSYTLGKEAREARHRANTGEGFQMVGRAAR
jgi:hypothetical protein